MVFSAISPRREDILNGVFSKSEFWRAHAQEKLTDRQKKVINRLLDEGPGGFEGGDDHEKICVRDPLQPGNGFSRVGPANGAGDTATGRAGAGGKV